jgi:hypothetical protein
LNESQRLTDSLPREILDFNFHFCLIFLTSTGCFGVLITHRDDSFAFMVIDNLGPNRMPVKNIGIRIIRPGIDSGQGAKQKYGRKQSNHLFHGVSPSKSRSLICRHGKQPDQKSHQGQTVLKEETTFIKKTINLPHQAA